MPNNSNRPDFSSPTYPYRRVVTGANTLKGAELIPYKILNYLLDLPDANGYVPPTSNDYPRVRLMRYLWNDGPRPLEGELPTPEQRLSMLFDPDEQVLNTDLQKKQHPKGYRLFWQRVVEQSVLDAKTIIRCYIGNIVERRKFLTTIGITFEVWSHVGLETNTKTHAYDRTVNIEQCLHEALDGVDIAGIGTVGFSREESTSNGSEQIWDDSSHVGRLVNCSILWAEGGGGTIGNCK